MLFVLIIRLKGWRTTWKLRISARRWSRAELRLRSAPNWCSQCLCSATWQCGHHTRWSPCTRCSSMTTACDRRSMSYRVYSPSCPCSGHRSSLFYRITSYATRYVICWVGHSKNSQKRKSRRLSLLHSNTLRFLLINSCAWIFFQIVNVNCIFFIWKLLTTILHLNRLLLIDQLYNSQIERKCNLIAFLSINENI